MAFTRLVTQEQVRGVLTMSEALDAVEAAFRAYGEGEAQMPPKSYLDFDRGDLRCMPAYIPDLQVASVKNVNVHPGNTDMPAVMGTLTVFDPETGFARAIMDATWLTAMRTGAAGGIAAKYLARSDSRVASFIGAGPQAWTQLEALLLTVPSIESVIVCDLDEARSNEFVAKVTETFGLSAEICGLPEAVGRADVLTTVTPSRKPLVMRQDLKQGVHINAIGADAVGKQELEVAVLLDANVVVDNWEQSSHGGEINVAVSSGAFSQGDLYGEIGEIVTGRRPGRTTPEEITVFDSTGLAIQDCACAARVLTLLAEQGATLTEIDFMS